MRKHSTLQPQPSVACRVKLYPCRTLYFVSLHNLEPSDSFPPFSDIRTMENSVQGQYTSMETNGPLNPGGSCAECATECQDASCPVATMSAQCTDQCVVVACSDPAHGEMSCHSAQHCDTCDNETDCSNCDGFEEFVSCIV